MSEFCRKDETEEDLQRNGYRILQKKDGFRFGLDAVLLSSFAKLKQGERLLDMGTGSGVIPILVEAKNEGTFLTGLEIMPEVADMAERSVEMNGLGSRIKIINGDCREAGQLFGEASFDVVTCNPPYLKNEGPVSENTEKAIARHEIALSLDEMAREAYTVLRPHGRFYLVHRPGRISEILAVFRERKLTPKRLRFVHQGAAAKASLFLLEAVKDAGEGIEVMPPLIICDDKGEYTPEVAEMYGLIPAGKNTDGRKG